MLKRKSSSEGAAGSRKDVPWYRGSTSRFCSPNLRASSPIETAGGVDGRFWFLEGGSGVEVGDTFAHAQSESMAEGCREAASKEKLRNIAAKRSSDVLQAQQVLRCVERSCRGLKGSPLVAVTWRAGCGY